MPSHPPIRRRAALPPAPGAPSAARRRPALSVLLLAGLLGLGACQAQPAAGPGAAAEAALLARIRAAVGTARCSSDAQCRTLPIGEKSCGGPEQWLAYSTAGAPAGQPGQLQAWSAELAALARQRHATSGMAGNCQYVPDPGAVCQDQRCMPRTPMLAR